jgi:hypothetical protein
VFPKFSEGKSLIMSNYLIIDPTCLVLYWGLGVGDKKEVSLHD